MSRSYKHTPVYKDGSENSKVKKYCKRQANKKIRNKPLEYRKKSNDYKKGGVNSWDICDYRFFVPKTVDMSKEDVEHWNKYYYRK